MSFPWCLTGSVCVCVCGRQMARKRLPYVREGNMFSQPFLSNLIRENGLFQKDPLPKKCVFSRGPCAAVVTLSQHHRCSSAHCSLVSICLCRSISAQVPRILSKQLSCPDTGLVLGTPSVLVEGVPLLDFSFWFHLQEVLPMNVAVLF